MSDEADLAQLIEEEARAKSISHAAHLLARQGRDFCSDCGEKIELFRRRALPSATRCISCQQTRERR